jgi:hypothetical protein
MSQFTDTSAHADVIRNQQVVSSSLTAGSIQVNDLAEIDPTPRWWQGAYRVAYRRLLAFFGYGPASSLQPFTDDLDTAERTKDLTRRLRG